MTMRPALLLLSSPLLGLAFVSPSPRRETNRLHAKTSNFWTTDDDWSRLSRREDEAASPRPENGKDLVIEAAKAMELNDETFATDSKEEEWVSNAMETINDPILDAEMPNEPLYDMPSEKFSVTMEDDMGREISMLVRCNESPENMLIEQGRALLPLSDEERNDISQLVSETGKPTDFFRNAITAMFKEHADENDVLKGSGVAAWMTKSLDAERRISPHDKRVLATVTRFAAYGTGALTLENFHELYKAAMKATLDGSSLKLGKKMGLKGQPTVDTIWRDIRNHNILSPVEALREIEMLAIRKKAGDAAATTTPADTMDECEILELGQNVYATTTHQTPKYKDKELSSHELVEMAFDKKTPLYLRDGEFIFIDEDSCIGCMQCVTASPSSFLMLDNGRARSYLQRNDPDVTAAVNTCPVNCMKRVSYDELTEFETARENGDGRTDHRHCGSSKGPTPLYVNDQPSKSSWYHYLKSKCLMSKECPQRGCYDCPNFTNPGDNPNWKRRNAQAEHMRAATFIDNGEAKMYRKAADL